MGNEDGNSKAAAIMAAAKFESEMLKERRRRERERGTDSSAVLHGNPMDFSPASDLLVSSIGDFFSAIDF